MMTHLRPSSRDNGETHMPDDTEHEAEARALDDTQPMTASPETPSLNPEGPPAEAPTPEPQIFIAFIFRGPGSAEFQIQRHPSVSPMMLSPVKDWLETQIRTEFSMLLMEAEKQRQAKEQTEKSLREKLARRLKTMPGGKLFGGKN